MSTQPKGWRTVQIGDVFDVQQGKAVNVKAREGENLQPFLRTANVFWNHFDLSVLDKMHFSDAEKEKLALRTDDILVCEGGDIGRTAIWQGQVSPCYYQNHLHRLRPKQENEVSPEFFGLWMETAITLRGMYISQGNKTTIPNLSSARLQGFEIPLPPIEEQKSIARVLMTVQEAKEIRRHEAQLERERKAALMQQLFTYGTRGEELKDTTLGKMPQSWDVVTLGDSYDFTTKPRNRKFSDFKIIPFLPMELIPIGGGEIKNFVFKKPSELTSGTYVEKGDLLVAKITPSFENGKQGTLNYILNDFGLATTEVIPLRGRDKVSDTTFVSYYLLQQHIRTELASKMEGTTGRRRLSKSVLSNLDMPLPSIQEQKTIASIFRACDAKITALENEISRLDELFRALLEELMSGRLSTAALLETEAA